MSETSHVPLFRFACPHCGKVLKARLEWAGKRGVCPTCNKSIEFPAYTPPSGTSRTAQQLVKMVNPDDNITFDENDCDKFSMLLSQATCRDFGMARKLLENRPLSAKQWRKILNSAAARESMRVRIEEQLEKLAEIPDDDSEPAALVAAAEMTNPNAWTSVARYLYYLRHGNCEACQKDPTGLSCIYLTFESFALSRMINDDRATAWQKIIHHHLGL